MTATPVVYEDFLPRSAAGIFQSNLSGEGTRDSEQHGVDYDQAWLAGAIDRPIHDPFDLYEREQNESIQKIATKLQLSGREWKTVPEHRYSLTTSEGIR